MKSQTELSQIQEELIELNSQMELIISKSRELLQNLTYIKLELAESAVLLRQNTNASVMKSKY